MNSEDQKWMEQTYDIAQVGFQKHKRGCVIPMVIWPAFRMGQYRVNDHPYRAPQFTANINNVDAKIYN